MYSALFQKDSNKNGCRVAVIFRWNGKGVRFFCKNNEGPQHHAMYVPAAATKVAFAHILPKPQLRSSLVSHV
jgi:hypothetical protein